MGAKIMQKIIAELLKHFDIKDEEVLQNTPKRVEKALNELWKGLFEPEPKLAFFPTIEDMLIKVEKISFVSTCEHHLMPFFGSAEISFISSGKTLGLSKFNRLVQHYAAKPTIQEKLCSEIFNKINDVLEPKYLKVLVSAKHTCVSFRGIKDSCSNTTTIMEKHK